MNKRASYRTQEPNASTNALSDVDLVIIYSATMKHVATTLLVNCYGVSWYEDLGAKECLLAMPFE